MLRNRRFTRALLPASALALLLASCGGLDPTFGEGGVVTFGSSLGAKEVVATADEIIVAGPTHEYGPPFVSKFDNAGNLDMSFGDAGIRRLQEIDTLDGLARQADAKMVVAGLHECRCSARAVRLHPDGGLDEGFGSGSGFVDLPIVDGRSFFPNAVALAPLDATQPERIVIAGTLVPQFAGSYIPAVFVLLRDGTPDPAFGDDGLVTLPVGERTIGELTNVQVQANGVIVAGGSFVKDIEDPATSRVALLARFHADGALDSTFGRGGIAYVAFPDFHFASMSMTLRADGSIALAGAAWPRNGTAGVQAAILHTDASGTPDEGFGTEGRVLTSFGGMTDVTGVAALPSGKLLAVGNATRTAPDNRRDIGAVRLLANGGVDAGFATGGIAYVHHDYYDTAGGIALQPNGRVLSVGESQVPAGYVGLIARFVTPG